jgi:hypothetical protein
VTEPGQDHNEGVVTLRDIYNVVMETKDTVTRMDERVKDLEELPQRVSALEKGHSRMMGIALGGSTVAASAITIIGWTIGK